MASIGPVIAIFASKSTPDPSWAFRASTKQRGNPAIKATRLSKKCGVVQHSVGIMSAVPQSVKRNLLAAFLGAESGGGKGLFERTIISDTRITRDDLSAFDKYVRNRGQLFADDVDNWLSSRSPPGPGDMDAVNTGIGLYHFVVNEEDEREFARVPTISGM